MSLVATRLCLVPLGLSGRAGRELHQTLEQVALPDLAAGPPPDLTLPFASLLQTLQGARRPAPLHNMLAALDRTDQSLIFLLSNADDALDERSDGPDSFADLFGFTSRRITQVRDALRQRFGERFHRLVVIEKRLTYAGPWMQDQVARRLTTGAACDPARTYAFWSDLLWTELRRVGYQPAEPPPQPPPPVPPPAPVARKPRRTASILESLKVETVMSLGVDCRVRWQISRYFDGMRALPPQDQASFGDRAAGEIQTGTNLLDWNLIWFHQVISMFEQRFEGLFDRECLLPVPGHLADAEDGRYGFRYGHLFTHAEGTSFQDMLAAQYGKKSKIVFYLRDQLLERLKTESPTLYVRCQGTEDEAQKFCRMMRQTYPVHRFHLLVVDIQDQTIGFTARHEDYSIYQMNGHVRKGPQAQWTGDDDEWNALFQGLSVMRELV